MCKEEVCLCQNLHLRPWALSSDPKVQGLACQRWKLASYSAVGICLGDEVKRSDIQRELGVESLHFFGIERSKRRWFGHLISMHPDHLPSEGLKAPGLDLDLLEGLQILFGLRVPQGSLEGSGEEEEARNTLLQPGFGLDGEWRRAAGSFCRIRCDAFMRLLCFSETLKPRHRFPTLYFLVHRI